MTMSVKPHQKADIMEFHVCTQSHYMGINKAITQNQDCMFMLYSQTNNPKAETTTLCPVAMVTKYCYIPLVFQGHFFLILATFANF